MAEVPHVKLVDSTFPFSNSVGYAGENDKRKPELMEWDRSDGYADVKVWTDLRLHEAENDDARFKIALLVESPVFSKGAYEYIYDRGRDVFDAILTFNNDILSRLENAYFYLLGGSWIEDKNWGVHSKHRGCSVITGHKKNREGQLLRHSVAKHYPGVDVYGMPQTNYFASKTEPLRDYHYSVIIENCQQDYYFTEKLIDCFSQGTVPIYWGCPSIGELFDLGGIITFDKLADLEGIFEHIGTVDYQLRYKAIFHNFEEAKKYRCAEDWIMREYPRLLTEGKI